MKTTLAILLLSLTSSIALAHPGGHSLKCKSAKDSGSRQKVEFILARANGGGWSPPEYSLRLDGRLLEFKTEDETKTFGRTIHESPLGVIHVTAENLDEENAPFSSALSLVAIPKTVRAFDTAGKPVAWKFEEAKNECYDANGKAKFKAMIRGWLRENSQPESKGIPFDSQILDCELEYSSGMAC